MEFRVLGPLEVREGGVALPLGGSRQRAVLAYLLLEANRVVPTDRLIDQIWGDEPPDAARAALFAYISRLRKLLGAARIEGRPPGYVLVAAEGDIDALRFEALVAKARREADAEASATLLAEALALWRGSALSDLAEYDALRPAISRLEELRLGATEDRVEAELTTRRHREAVAQLESLTREHPLRERMWGQLMLALYRSGRQADALSAYHRARTMLVEELGIDPSPDLQRLHQRVLQQDPALMVSPVSAGPIPEPFAPAAAGGATRPGRRYLGGALVLGLLVVLGGAALLAQGRGTLPQMEWTIGVDMPLSGARAPYGQPVRNAVEMAVDDVNAAGGIDGSTLAALVMDDASNADRAVANARSFVEDPGLVAVIGPWGSAEAFGVIPITNEAELLQCSPASTHPGLTKPRDGALDLRAAHPEAINFLRLPPADDIQAVALASFAYRDLRVRHVLVIDDADIGRVIADPFEAAFKALGGTTTRRALNAGADPMTVLAPLDEPLNPPRLVFFGGQPDTGAVALRTAMVAAGHDTTPFLSWDTILDGDGRDPPSYIGQVGGAVAVGSYAAHASLPDQKASFAAAYRQRFGFEPDEYSAAGYACVEIVAAALRVIASQGPSVGEVRELLREVAADPARRWETVLGTLGFDANGDALQQFVTFYRVEASAADGAGDWVIFKKQDFGPAP